MPRSARVRTVNWCDHLTPHARAAGEWYTLRLLELGALPPHVPGAFYVSAMPDEEEYMRTVQFRKGEPAPAPVVFDCPPGGDPYPVVRIRGGTLPVHDGDIITVGKRGQAIGVRAGAEQD